MPSVNAVDEAIRGLNGIPYVEFTTALINGVFDSLLDNHLAQMKAHAALLEATATDLTTYLRETSPDISDDDTLAFLGALPEIRHHASVKVGSATLALTDVIDKAKAATASTDIPLSASALGALRERLVIANIPNNLPAAGTGATTNVPSAALFQAVAERIAANRFALLSNMVRQGMMRLVVDHGEIETRFVFSAFERHSDSISESSTSRSGTASSSSATAGTAVGVAGGGGAVIGAGVAGLGLGLGTFTGKSEASSRRNLRIRHLTESHRDTSGSSVKFYSRVKISFKTDFLPLSR